MKKTLILVILLSTFVPAHAQSDSLEIGRSKNSILIGYGGNESTGLIIDPAYFGLSYRRILKQHPRYISGVRFGTSVPVLHNDEITSMMYEWIFGKGPERAEIGAGAQLAFMGLLGHVEETFAFTTRFGYLYTNQKRNGVCGGIFVSPTIEIPANGFLYFGTLLGINIGINL